jgi:hypothetical protein
MIVSFFRPHTFGTSSASRRGDAGDFPEKVRSGRFRPRVAHVDSCPRMAPSQQPRDGQKYFLDFLNREHLVFVGMFFGMSLEISILVLS